MTVGENKENNDNNMKKWYDDKENVELVINKVKLLLQIKGMFMNNKKKSLI